MISAMRLGHRRISHALVAAIDTSHITDGDKSGPGWSEYMREDTRRFRIRHPDGSRNW